MRFKKASALFIALAVVGVACGDNSKDNAAGTAAPAAPGGTAAPAGTGAPAAGGTLIIATDLPLQGASKDASDDTNNAVSMLIEQAGGKAGAYNVALKSYDDSTAAKGGWDDATCAKNANDHVANAAEVAVMGTYNSGCAKIEVPVLNQDPSGPMLMISHANTNPGLTKVWDPGEPDKFYPTGVRNYGRVIATDDFQGAADAQFAKQDLKVTKCVVLNDAQTYGVGVATAFKEEAKKQGIEIVADEAWDAKQPNYTALFEGFKDLKPDCVFLGGINDNNGEQLIRDKVAVLGANDGAVKLIAPDGFTGYPTVQKLAEAQNMYISFAGLPAGELVKAGGAGAKFVTDFKAKFGHDPASAYAIYGAAATQYIMAAIAASDGTRKGVLEAAFSGKITITADKSVIGKEFSIDSKSGDVTVKDMSIQLLTGNVETFLKAWPVA
ncbi:MAG: branched-chain amino acid ABC transporter substrate-binding protein [Ilumatobacteraceae bacterium]